MSVTTYQLFPQIHPREVNLTQRSLYNSFQTMKPKLVCNVGNGFECFVVHFETRISSPLLVRDGSPWLRVDSLLNIGHRGKINVSLYTRIVSPERKEALPSCGFPPAR